MSETYTYIALLTIAGSDSGGGAGIQADLKTFSALGCYGTSAITAVTIQNTLGVSGIHNIPAAVVRCQIRAVMDDIKPSAIKIGMVQSAEQVIAIADVLKDYPDVPIIFDPVMVSTSGHKLIDSDTVAIFHARLMPLAQLITPNLDEAEILTAMKINTIEDMKIAAAKMIKAGYKAVLIKGGHLKHGDLFDVYLDQSGLESVFKSVAITTSNTHGTGCTLSSAIASFVAQGYDMVTAINEAKAFVHKAILSGQNVKTGEGCGPLNHFFKPTSMLKRQL